MTTITVGRTISMGHRLPSYNGVCSSLHGHNVRIEVTLRVSNEFVDFKAVDTYLAELTDSLDHSMVLYDGDPWLGVLRELPTRIVTLNVEPTTEALAKLVSNWMNNHVLVDHVTVHETDKYSATYSGVFTDVDICSTYLGSDK